MTAGVLARDSKLAPTETKSASVHVMSFCAVGHRANIVIPIILQIYI